MLNNNLYPVILCGGAGTRLWPLSRKSYPKQFAQILSEVSLFQRSVLQFRAEGFAPPVVVTGEPFRFIVTEQLAATETDPSAILVEPEARNTAPAIAAAALHLAAEAGDRALMIIAPSDHVIADDAAFRAAIQAAAPAAESGAIVTFGIAPTEPETAYGYLDLGPEGDVSRPEPQKLARFVEKPDAAHAAEMLADGRHLWNAGIFLASAGTLIEAFRTHAPDTLAAVETSLADGRSDLGFIRPAHEPWAQADDISVDYAIMEKSENLVAMPLSVGWSDLGGWPAVQDASSRDERGNALSGDVLAMDCQGSLLRADSQGQVLVGIGLEDMIAVAMGDAVLVARKSDSQRVREAVDLLKTRGTSQATQLPREYRPWGWYESLSNGERFQVKRIMVKPGAALSLQSHMHRSEHWIVVQGTAQVTIDQDQWMLTENQSAYVPVGSVHRLENSGKVPVILIEVQTGSYLGEDDIIRYEDVYARA